MATYTKRGNSYLIRASSGYTVDGKQVRPSMTWKPDPDMTERQILTNSAAARSGETDTSSFRLSPKSG